MRRVIITITKWFAIVWGTLAALIVVISIIGIFIGSPSLWEGWKKLIEIYSPFNVWNIIILILLFSPAIGTYALYNWLLKK